MNSNIEEAIEAIKSGEVIIVGSERGGNFVCGVELLTNEKINLITAHGRKLNCKNQPEIATDLMRLAKLEKVGICCEVKSAEGKIMNYEEVLHLAKKYDLKFITSEVLNEYLKKNNPFVKREAEVIIPTKHGDFKTYAYFDRVNNKEHLALVKGEIKENMLCRVHSECLTGDVFGSKRCDCGEQLDKSMELINEKGGGIILYLRQEGRGIGLINKLKAYELQDTGIDTYDANIKLGFDPDMREYDIAANILDDLNIGSVDLITNNPEKISELKKYGIVINSRVALNISPNEKNLNYLKTKKQRMGHLLDEL